MSLRPLVSVIVPVYNTERYLRESLDSILAQTYAEFEIICVDDQSTDGSVGIIRKYMARDKRVRIMEMGANRGAGAARNAGFAEAGGKYVIFLDSDDLFAPSMLERSVSLAEETGADIVAFDFKRLHADGAAEEQKGVYRKWLPKGALVFNYQDCPDLIMSTVHPTPWNKLYRSEFIRAHGLKFDELSSTNDISFAAISVASADAIAILPESLLSYRVGHEGTITSTKGTKLNNVQAAVVSAVEQARALPYFDQIKNSVMRFAIENLYVALERYVEDIKSEIGSDYYEFLHEFFNSDLFDACTPAGCHSELLYQKFTVIRNTAYRQYAALSGARITVSLTSFPGRIGSVASALETIYNQSKVPDRVMLWLAEEQFPAREAELPEDLVRLVSEGKLLIRWCDDLKPHKKYFYMLQEESEGVVITVDDDLLYPKEMIEKLFLSYIQYPRAVSAVRAHLIAVNEEGKFLPYQYWLRETDALMYQPRMYLFATGGAGALYPPGIFSPEVFDKNAVLNTCLMADDLWMKAMEVICGVPVVLASSHRRLKYVPGSQETALYHQNLYGNENDRQLEEIIRWVDGRYGSGFFVSRLLAEKDDDAKLGIEEIYRHVFHRLERDRQDTAKLRSQLRTSERKLKAAEKGQDELQKKLKKAEAETKKLKKANQNLKRSHSYRIGRLLTWPVRKLKALMKKLGL